MSFGKESTAPYPDDVVNIMHERRRLGSRPERTPNNSLETATVPSIHDSPNFIREHLLKQRPHNPKLYCCDYEAAEAEARAGRPGKREFGGGYLCWRSLGAEEFDIESDQEKRPDWDKICKDAEAIRKANEQVEEHSCRELLHEQAQPSEDEGRG